MCNRCKVFRLENNSRAFGFAIADCDWVQHVCGGVLVFSFFYIILPCLVCNYDCSHHMLE